MRALLFTLLVGLTFIPIQASTLNTPPPVSAPPGCFYTLRELYAISVHVEYRCHRDVHGYVGRGRLLRPFKHLLR
jgi:hypothetical protein